LASHSLCELQARERRDFDITNQQIWGRGMCGFESLIRVAEGPSIPTFFPQKVGKH
jgi:hypothetical protein